MSKTLGQVARDTFGNATGPTIADDWEAAAQAVLAEAERLTPQECAVIKAAEAWWDDDDRSPKYAQFLGLAIEQLQAAEGEG